MNAGRARGFSQGLWVVLVVGFLLLRGLVVGADMGGRKLLVTSVRTGDTEVYVADPVWGDMANLSRSPGSEDRYPCWSPDGRQVAFISDRNLSTNLYVMGADGGQVRQVTFSRGVCYMPSWQVTPDGERIVFGLHGEKPEMASVRPDGSDLKVLGEGHDPTLSPDGRSICYTGHPPEGGVTVYVMAWDGTGKRRVVAGTSRVGATFPYWSPDGRQIVYSFPVAEALELFLIRPDGTEGRQLTTFGGSSVCTPSAWSPDGEWISFRRTDERYWSHPARMVEVYARKPADKRPVWLIRPDGRDAQVVESLRFQMAIDGSRASFEPQVVFPSQGAAPTDFPEEGSGAKILPDGVYVLSEPRRSKQVVLALLLSLPGGTFSSPSNRWEHLRRTRARLESGEALRVVNLGDSIVNDTARSGWIHLIRRQWPKANITMTTVVRGGTGCGYYREQNRVRELILPLEPDLVFIGGISQGSDVGAIGEVVGQLRAVRPEVEVILATGVFGAMDPWREDTLRNEGSSTLNPYGETLRALAASARCAFVDMTGPWAAYIRRSGRALDWFKRDAVHANERGEMILARILEAQFLP